MAEASHGHVAVSRSKGKCAIGWEISRTMLGAETEVQWRIAPVHVALARIWGQPGPAAGVLLQTNCHWVVFVVTAHRKLGHDGGAVVLIVDAREPLPRI